MSTFDSALAGSSGSASSITISHVLGSGSNRIVAIATAVDTSGVSCTGVTYNGVSCTAADVAYERSNIDLRWWYILEANLPSAGTYDVVATYSGAGNVRVAAVSYLGMNQTGPEANPTGGDGYNTLHDLTITTVNDGAVVFTATTLADSQTISPDDWQTQRASNTTNGRAISVDTIVDAVAGVIDVGSSWATSANNVRAAISWAPVSPSVISSPTPSGTISTKTTATVGCTTDTSSGTLYAVVDTDSLSGITAAQVKAGTDAADTAVVWSGNGAVSTTSPSLSVTGLSPGVVYNYAIVQDIGSDSNVITGTFTTDGSTFTTVSISSTTTDGFVVNATITGADGTVYFVSIPKGDTAPSAAQIVAGTNGDDEIASNIGGASGSKTFTADVADTITISGLDFPLYDIYLVVDGDISSLLDQLKSAPTGYQYKVETLTGSPPAGSYLDSSSVTGDVWELSATASPSGAGVVPTEDGFLSLAQPVVGRQNIKHRQYDVSAQIWFVVEGEASGTYADIWLNNEPPIEITPIPNQQWATNVTIDPIRLDGVHVSDAENDLLIYTIDVALPNGVTINLVTDPDGDYYQISGTPLPDSEGTTSHVITATDITEDFTALTSFDITVSTGVQVPDVTTVVTTETDAITAILSSGLDIDETSYIDDNTLSEGIVYSSSPIAGTWVAPNTIVYLVVEGNTVPNVEGISVDAAVSNLVSLGFNVTQQLVLDELVDPGIVLSQSESGGTILGPGSEISLIVSEGVLPGKPSEQLQWATNLVYETKTIDGQEEVKVNRKSIPTGYQNTGILFNEPVDKQWLNQTLYLAGQWFSHLDLRYDVGDVIYLSASDTEEQVSERLGGTWVTGGTRLLGSVYVYIFKKTS